MCDEARNVLFEKTVKVVTKKAPILEEASHNDSEPPPDCVVSDSEKRTCHALSIVITVGSIYKQDLLQGSSLTEKGMLSHNAPFESLGATSLQLHAFLVQRGSDFIEPHAIESEI